MGKIHELPPEVAEKIAAGEVVERPASVLKELIENALDAGARQVHVALRGGGKELVRVQDDGEGIAADDLPLAVARYATSKISSAEDLWSIGTFGFRGEALSSIGRVAELTITSKVRGRDGATIRVSGGASSEVKPAACPDGTIVEVRDLFFTVPARRKFLKRDSTEFAHASEWVVRAALGTEGTGFRLESEGKIVWNVPADASLRERIAMFFGPDVSEKLLAVAAAGPIDVRGAVGRPEVWRADRSHLHCYINGRFVRDRTLGQAVLEAFRGYLIPGRFPFAVLAIRLDPERVDVNAHPAKAEVRFANGQEVFHAVFRAVRAALATIGPRPIEVERPRPPDAREIEALVAAGRGAPAPGVPPAEIPARMPAGSPAAATCAELSARQDADAGEAGTEGTRAGTPSDRALQVGRRYLVFEVEDGLEIADQHALHEKILYGEILERLERGGIAAQGLLAPAFVRVLPEEIARIEAAAPLLRKLGLTCEVAGPTLVKVTTVPASGGAADPETVLRELLPIVATRPAGELAKELAERLACSLAVKTGRALSPEEAAALLARARGAPDTDTCPHGRPTRLRITFGQLERHFDRR